MASTDFFTTVYTDVPEFYTYAFAVKISNDQIYGGCGSFKCSAKNLNGGKVQLKYDRGTGYMYIVCTKLCYLSDGCKLGRSQSLSFLCVSTPMVTLN